MSTKKKIILASAVAVCMSSLGGCLVWNLTKDQVAGLTAGSLFWTVSQLGIFVRAGDRINNRDDV